ncbi:MAG: hypothetical protein FWC03_01565 [Treponema sp.]|nr:hypothetical protein [Treponema sp.]
MSFSRSVLVLCLASLVAMFGLLVFGSKAGYDEYRSGYAVLTFNSDIEDSAVRELLDAGIDSFAGSPVSESLQWVLLDEFDSVNVIPLEEYAERVFPFDPRNDGYAQKLKDIFIHNGKRFVYIPLNSGNWAQTLMDQQFRNLLGDIPFAADYFAIGKPLSFYFITFAAASLALLIICYVKKKFQPGVISIITLLPVLLSLSFFGAPGIAAAALLVGFAVMLREPLYELFLLYRNHRSGIKRKKIFRKNFAEPYMMHLILLPVFIAALAALTFLTELNYLFMLIIFITVCALFTFAIKTLSLMGGNHRRFSPVLINRKQIMDFNFSLYMLPFTIAAFAVMLLTPNMSGAYVSDGKLNHVNIIDEQEYYAHLIFQSSFSVRQFGSSSSGYPSYMFDKDGLPVPDPNSVSVSDVNLNSYPPFPLKHLMEFFGNLGSPDKVNRIGYNNQGMTGNMSLLILLLFILPGLFSIKFINDRINYMPKGQFAVINRSPGVLYGADISRRKTLLYSAPGQKNEGSYSYKSKKSFRIQRDA